MKKKGISLIVLSITILVMAILAAAVIISLENSGIIGRAKSTTTSQNYADEYTRLMVIKNGILTDNLGTITVEEYINELKSKGIIEDAVIDNGDGTKTITTKSGFEVIIGQSGASDLDIVIDGYTDVAGGSGNGSTNEGEENTAVICATFTDGAKLTWEELKLTSNGQKYGYNAEEITDTSLGYSAFENCTMLKSIIIPSEITYIESCFYGCTSLTSVSLPETLVGIGGGTFGNCTSLETIVIPNSVKTMMNGVFACCTKLKNVTLPNSIEEMGSWIFGECTSLEHIVWPDSIDIIPMATFDGCTALKTITIPASVTAIGGDAFYGCTALTDVYYAGTRAEWNAITIVVEASDPTYYGATLHCNYVG